jgi:hypothetical protein
MLCFASEYARACYEETIPSIPWSQLLPANGTIAPKNMSIETLEHIKHVFKQGMHIIDFLRRHDLIHRDLIWSNLLLRSSHETASTTGAAASPYTLTVIDLSAAARLSWWKRNWFKTIGNVSTPATQGSQRRLFQQEQYPDAKQLACIFWQWLYFGKHRCHIDGTSVVLPSDRASLEYALVSIVLAHPDSFAEVDMDLVTSLLADVTHV